jgi:phosphoglycolate phosphatase
VKKTIIFDFDGTIADSFEVIKNILLNLSSEFGYKKLSENEIAQLRKKPPLEIIKITGVSFYKIPFLILRVKKEMHKHIPGISPVYGIKESLLDLKSKKYILGIVTTNSERNVRSFLQKNGLDFFDFIQSANNIFGKTQVLNHVLKNRKINKDDVVYVGDEIRDIEAAKKAGIKIVAVSWGFNTKDGLKKFHPDVVIDTPDFLLRSIQKLDED